MVDQLASEYSAWPVVFIENNVDNPIGERIDRWFSSYGSSSGSIYLPLVMADSGHGISTGPVDYHLVYSNLVDAELARPPAGEVEAYSRRVGNAIRVYVRLVNGSGGPVSGALQDATVHALVWEDKKVGVTSHTLRAAPSSPIQGTLAPGAAYTVTLDTTTLTGVSWDKLHTLALADYRPGEIAGPYDILQAALAGPSDMTVSPTTLAASANVGDADDTIGTVALRGPYVMGWTASTDALWLTVTPGSGGLPADPAVGLVLERMATGVQTGHVAFSATSADGLSSTRTVEVTVELKGTPSRMRRRGIVRSLPAP